MPLIDPVTMSAPGPKTAPPTATSKTTEPGVSAPLQPTQVKATPIAQTAQFAFPALVVALFLVRFDALVADPVATLAGSLPALALLQAVYVLTSLPVAGSAAASKAAKKARPGEKKKATGEPIAFVVCFGHP